MSEEQEQRHHVVIIEDNVTTNNLLRDWLKLSFRVTCFLDAETTKKLLTPSDAPVVFVVDYNLPGANGIELKEHLDAKFPKNKVILISGLFDQQLTQQAKDAGIEHLLPKPFALPALDAKIRELFGLPNKKTNLVDVARGATAE